MSGQASLVVIDQVGIVNGVRRSTVPNGVQCDAGDAPDQIDVGVVVIGHRASNAESSSALVGWMV